MAKALVYSKVRSSLGLEHCHSFLSGAAPLTEETSSFFLSLDIPIGEIYGLSESTGPHAMSTHSDYRILRYRLRRPGSSDGGLRGGGWVDPTSPERPHFSSLQSPSFLRRRSLLCQPTGKARATGPRVLVSSASKFTSCDLETPLFAIFHPFRFHGPFLGFPKVSRPRLKD